MSVNWILKDCYKSYTLDQDKARPPEETVAAVKERLDQAGLDVLAETSRIDSGRLDIPVYISRCGPDAMKVMPTSKQMGKGATPAQAEASAVMEMIERYSFFHFVHNHDFIRATYDQVKDRALPFEHLAASVHHDPADLDRAYEAVKDITLSWTPAFNLTRGREFLVPFDWFYEINEFNGPAAGNTMEEAIMQGLAELVERHTCALICREHLEVPTIDCQSLADPVARELVEKFRRQGISFFVKDFTLDMGLATVGALAYDPSTFPDLSEIVFTAGTTTNPEKSVIRALTEVAQLAGDFYTRSNFVASGLPKYTDLTQAAYITRDGPVVPVSSLPNTSHENIRVEIETTVKGLSAKNLEVYAVDVTHPEIQVPAVYTIMPGAHFRERAVASNVPFFAAKILSRLEDPFEMDAGLERIRQIYPDGYYLYFYKGQALLAQERFFEAAQALEKARSLNPTPEDEAGILTYLGIALKEMEEYDRAIDILELSAGIDQERQDTYNLLGFCYFKIKRHQKAINAFQEVLRLDPGSGIDYANIGVNLRELGRLDEAVKYFNIALRLDPSLSWVEDQLSLLEDMKTEGV